MATPEQAPLPHVVEGPVLAEDLGLEQPGLGQMIGADGSLITEPVLGLRMLMSSRVSALSWVVGRGGGCAIHGFQLSGGSLRCYCRCLLVWVRYT